MVRSTYCCLDSVDVHCQITARELFIGREKWTGFEYFEGERRNSGMTASRVNTEIVGQQAKATLEGSSSDPA